MSLLPDTRVGDIRQLDNAAPSLHSHYKSFNTTTGSSAPCWMTFPRSLTTTPFERSSTGRFEACSCKPASGGLLPSSVQHHKLSLVFVTHSHPSASYRQPGVYVCGKLFPGTAEIESPTD